MNQKNKISSRVLVAFILLFSVFSETTYSAPKKTNQIITFGATPGLVANGTASVTATASSGLVVTLKSMTTKICRLTGSTVSAVAAGTCKITASQSGNSTYKAAKQVTQNIVIAKLSQTISYVDVSGILIKGNATLSFSSSSGLPVSLKSLTATICSIKGSIVTGKKSGTCMIAANQTGNSLYGKAAEVRQSFTVNSSYVANGQAQKGPLSNGSIIIATELDNSLNSNGKTLTTQTFNNLGSFRVSNITTNLVDFLATGYYMNELTGELSTSTLSISGFADVLIDSTPSVNILTSLQRLRAKALVLSGSSYASALIQSRNEVLSAFNIDYSKVNGLGPLYSMQINGTGDQDAVLLAVSSILSQMATTAAIAHNSSQAAELTNYINTIASDIQLTGKLQNINIINDRNTAGRILPLSAVRSNVENYYANAGIPLIAPKFEEWVDKDGSGNLPLRLAPINGLLFSDSSDVEPREVKTSNTIIVNGLGVGTYASVAVDDKTTIIKNGNVVSGQIASVQDGDTLALRATSLGYGLINTSSITVGASSTTWKVTSKHLSVNLRMLKGSGLVLQNNGSDNINIPVNSEAYSFPGSIENGSNYTVTILTQPSSPAQVCSVENGTGTVGTTQSNVIVSCAGALSDLTYTDQSEVEPSQAITSNTITVAGLGNSIVASVAVDDKTTIIKNGNVVSGQIASVQDGDTLALRATSLGYGLINTSSITVGASSTTWKVTTKLEPTVSITNLNSSTYINNISNSGTYAVNGSCSENGAIVTLKVNGVSKATPTCNNSNWSAVIDTTIIAEGSLTIIASQTSSGGHVASSNVTIIKDVTAPIIQALSSNNISDTGFTVSIQSSEPASSQVDYGSTSSYGTSIITSDMASTTNTILTGFAASSYYHYQVTLTDVAGNTRTSGDNIQRTASVINGGNINVDTTWTAAESPYLLKGNIRVMPGKTLTIEAGATILIGGNYYIKVSGTIQAIGNLSSPIILKPADAVNDIVAKWVGIKIDSTSTTTLDGSNNYVSGSTIQYATIRNASTGIYIWNTGFFGSNLDLSYNQAAIELRKTNGVSFKQSSFTHNNYAIYTEYEVYSGDAYGEIQNLFIDGNTLSNNVSGIYININQRNLTNAYITNNQFYSNTSNAVQIGGGGYGLHANGIYIEKNYFKGNAVSIDIDRLYSSILSPWSITVGQNVIISNTGNWLYLGHTQGATNALFQKNVIADSSGWFLSNMASAGISFESNSVTNVEGAIALSPSYYAYAPSNWTIQHNTFDGLAGESLKALQWGSGYIFSDNNILNESGQYIITDTLPSANGINAQFNYWGQETTSQLLANSNPTKIFDGNDNVDYSIVDTFNYSTTPLTTPPISRPKNVVLTPSSNDVSLSWSANPEANVGGYRIYWGTTSGFPYANVLDVGSVHNYTISNPGTDMRYFAVTAYKNTYSESNDIGTTFINENQTNGEESWFSEVSR
jgi:hypothetical protein